MCDANTLLRTDRSRTLRTRKLEPYLDLFSTFEPHFNLNNRRALNLVMAPTRASESPAS